MIIPSFHGIPYVSGRSCIRLMRVSAGERGGGHVIPAGVSCHWNTCSPGVFCLELLSGHISCALSVSCDVLFGFTKALGT